MARYAVESYTISERRACRLLNVSRSAFRYQPKRPDDGELADVLLRLMERWPRWGFGKMCQWLRKQGYVWNHKRIYRVYCQLGLNMRIKPRKRLPSRHPEPLGQPARPNDCWSLDFMRDSLENGRAFRVLNIIDDFNREALCAEIDFSIPSGRVVRVLDNLAAYRGYPQRIRSDNGPEFIAQALAMWAHKHGVTLDFIEPGKPAQNGYIERFNRTYREDVLDAYLFSSLDEVRSISAAWQVRYNTERPHDSLKDLTPMEYALVHCQPLAGPPVKNRFCSS
jgi:putative transposase